MTARIGLGDRRARYMILQTNRVGITNVMDMYMDMNRNVDMDRSMAVNS